MRDRCRRATLAELRGIGSRSRLEQDQDITGEQVCGKGSTIVLLTGCSADQPWPNANSEGGTGRAEMIAHVERAPLDIQAKKKDTQSRIKLDMKSNPEHKQRFLP